MHTFVCCYGSFSSTNFEIYVRPHTAIACKSVEAMSKQTMHTMPRSNKPLNEYNKHVIFFSLQVKRSVIISNKHGIYELPHELPIDL